MSGESIHHQQANTEKFGQSTTERENNPSQSTVHNLLGTTFSHAPRRRPEQILMLQRLIGNSASKKILGLTPSSSHGQTIQRAYEDKISSIGSMPETAAAEFLLQIQSSALYRLATGSAQIPIDIFIASGQLEPKHTGDTQFKYKDGEVFAGSGKLDKPIDKNKILGGVDIVITIDLNQLQNSDAILETLQHEFGVHVEPWGAYLQNINPSTIQDTAEDIDFNTQPGMPLSGGFQHAEFAAGTSPGFNALYSQVSDRKKETNQTDYGRALEEDRINEMNAFSGNSFDLFILAPLHNIQEELTEALSKNSSDKLSRQLEQVNQAIERMETAKALLFPKSTPSEQQSTNLEQQPDLNDLAEFLAGFTETSSSDTGSNPQSNETPNLQASETLPNSEQLDTLSSLVDRVEEVSATETNLKNSKRSNSEDDPESQEKRKDKKRKEESN